jgi:hypothetical protein
VTQTRASSQRTGAQPPSQRPSQARSQPNRTRSRLEPRGSVRLTGRGAVLLLFGTCFVSLLLAAWTGWSVAADALFIMACGTVACYTRPSGLRTLVMCPPLAFFAAAVLAQLIAASGAFAAAEGIFVTLGTSALWLFTGTALTIAVALVRGYRPERPTFAWLGGLRRAVRDLRPSRPGRG